MWFRALVVWACLIPASGSRASDFWDQVRTPALRAHVEWRSAVQHALRRGDGARATALLGELDATFAENADALVLQGLTHAVTGQQERAVRLLRDALAIDPAALDDPQWGARAALAAARVQDYRLAVDVLTRVVGAMPPMPLRGELFGMLGDMWMALGPAHLPAAIISYRTALHDGRNQDVRVLVGLALAFGRAGDDGAAREITGLIQAGARVEVVVAQLPLVDAEKHARLAVAAEAMNDPHAALTHWASAAEGTWFADHARARIAVLTAATTNHVRAGRR